MVNVNDIEQRVIETYQYLHDHPEISWKEINTTKYIEKMLHESSCNVNTFNDCTGVVGEFGNFSSDLPVVGIRADIDALWQEVNGEFQAFHSCGHDAHMAMVLGVLWMLEQSPEIKDLVATKFIFQPAEERGTGALKMIEKNVVDTIDYLFGVHLRPVQETKMGRATPVIVHGANRAYRVEIEGNDAHAARPHLNHNAIEIGAQIVTMLRNIHMDPRIPHSVKMTNFHAGGKSTNIIPGNASFSLDLRAQNNELMTELEKKVNGILEAIKNLYNVGIVIKDVNGVAAAKINEEAITIVRNAIISSLGEGKMDPPLETPGGDDFHSYTIKKPSLKATMLGLGCDLKPGLHHPDMTFNHKALMNGVNILHQAILNTYGI